MPVVRGETDRIRDYAQRMLGAMEHDPHRQHQVRRYHQPELADCTEYFYDMDADPDETRIFRKNAARMSLGIANGCSMERHPACQALGALTRAGREHGLPDEESLKAAPRTP